MAKKLYAKEDEIRQNCAELEAHMLMQFCIFHSLFNNVFKTLKWK